jgi:hypothetical protein
MPRIDKNDLSLSLRVEVEQIREHLHQKMLPTAQRLVGEEWHVWRYTVGNFVESGEKGSLFSWNERSIH